MEAEYGNLSVSWIGLLVGEGNRIHDHVTFKWKNKQFRVWIEEEINDWVPDSIGKVVVLDNVTSSSDSGRRDNHGIEEQYGFGDQNIPREQAMHQSKYQSVAEGDKGILEVNAVEDNVPQNYYNNIKVTNANNDDSRNAFGFNKDGEPVVSTGGAQGGKRSKKYCSNDHSFGTRLEVVKSAGKVVGSERENGVADIGIRNIGPLFSNNSDMDEGSASRNVKGLKSNSGGVQGHSQGKQIFFFESADQDRRPKKRCYKNRIRGKAQPVSGQSCPSSGERSKKRSRDDGSFNFDLNLLSNEQPSESLNVVKDKGDDILEDSGTETEHNFQEGVMPSNPDREEETLLDLRLKKS
ncbi:hypothetical protein Hanom_Chr03g00244971 [Helianthus anomalus]